MSGAHYVVVMLMRAIKHVVVHDSAAASIEKVSRGARAPLESGSRALAPYLHSTHPT